MRTPAFVPSQQVPTTAPMIATVGYGTAKTDSDH
ncbi:hypothetical protein PRIPAC_85763 [Pristionchus pacificus]|uniref:Uncharacterized protein n=1 Tax=Pristionchus pacificus TaxID=54126 RepID=A0A2A6BKY0_PRIPA|nr:hypothetical protein PRIPAC_85763 [Pristionchus pacificus]|eukprot:PDM66473.1 hypothetical protein PRIPAC_47890 [Pristionchus pacificus]